MAEFTHRVETETEITRALVLSDDKAYLEIPIWDEEHLENLNDLVEGTYLGLKERYDIEPKWRKAMLAMNAGGIAVLSAFGANVAEILSDGPRTVELEKVDNTITALVAGLSIITFGSKAIRDHVSSRKYEEKLAGKMNLAQQYLSTVDSE